MTIQEVMHELYRICDDAKTALLATVDSDGAPHMRWITPGLLNSVPGSVFFITVPHSEKVIHIKSNPQVQWQFQTRNLDRIITLNAKAIVHDNRGLVSDVLEQVGKRLTTFWKIGSGTDVLVAVECIIESVASFDPVKGTSVSAEFPVEAN